MNEVSETPERRTLSRRRFLVVSVGGAAVLGVAGSVMWDRYAASRASWVEQVVRRNLPGVVIDEASLAAFVRDTLAGDMLEPHTHRMAVFARQMLPWVALRIPKVRNGVEKLERRILTEYLVGSNFFQVSDPKRTRIVYHGPAIACGNPFARLG